MLLMLSATAELIGAAKKMTEADIRSTVKLGNTLTERPDVLAAADPSMFIDGVCAAPGNGVPASTSASDGDGAAVTGANAGARASSCEQFRARPRVGRAALHLALPRGHDASEVTTRLHLPRLSPDRLRPVRRCSPGNAGEFGYSRLGIRPDRLPRAMLL